MDGALGYIAREQTTKKTLPRTDRKENTAAPLLPWDRPQRKRWSLPLLRVCWLLGNVLPLLTVVSQCARHNILKEGMCSINAYIKQIFTRMDPPYSKWNVLRIFRRTSQRSHYSSPRLFFLRFLVIFPQNQVAHFFILIVTISLPCAYVLQRSETKKRTCILPPGPLGAAYICKR
jgi:hypothetical protein